MIEATARRASRDGLNHQLELRVHRLVVDEPPDNGGEDEGPTPLELLAASLASCVAVTLELYARRKGWDLGTLSVQVRYALPDRGQPTRVELVTRLPSDLSEEQIDRLQAIAAKCPVHRVLAGEISFEEHIELVSPSLLRG